MSIEQAWNSHTKQVLSTHKVSSEPSAGFGMAFSDASTSFQGEKPFKSQHPSRDNQFPETPKSAVGMDGTKQFPDTPSLITMLNNTFPNQKFEALFLGQNQFGDLGAQALAKTLQHNQTVRHLILPHNQLSHFAMAALADLLKVNHFIGWLVLNHNEISDKGAVELAEALKINHGVRHVILADNRIEDAGIIALADSLHHNQAVQTLCLQGNPFTTDGVSALVSLCRSSSTIQKLDIRDIGDVEHALIRELKDICEAKNITLRL